jgi:hypothetical protein
VGERICQEEQKAIVKSEAGNSNSTTVAGPKAGDEVREADLGYREDMLVVLRVVRNHGSGQRAKQ